uniref:Predicted nucleic acid-binding protein, contains PIN domain n=1 Tax=Candidatus Kentrum eta TaxID=2126337 RepID=A0A450VYQ1_9GAMM|nr:MAG: Predicted nucleic acid-binding protein, contains PIN domain [Candidatus Kentron sp. H]VFK06557.1 MAG: Predicted nucleic acid-binding protein, contains PIN domain [Candidatus Kentron sp. H]VFK09806.1 MAG: Predicted nucleic acid-binding protein, contains PIN domain [Candidatus Kentron sp. H]
MSASFIDTNIVIYSLGQDDAKQDVAIRLLSKGPVVSVQVLSEAANIMRRKLGFELSSIRAVVERIANECETIQSLNYYTLQKGLDLSVRYGFSHYDSLIVASALETGCTKLYSEDMHHALTVNRILTIINPFETSGLSMR